MSIFWLVCLVLLFVLLVMTTSMRPVRSKVSQFELKRRVKEGDTEGLLDQQREQYADDIRTTLHVITALLLVGLILGTVAAGGWLFGGVAAVFITLEYAAIARFSFVHVPAQRLYMILEPYMLRFVAVSHKVLRLVRIQPEPGITPEVYSKDELIDLVKRSPAALSAGDRRLVVHALAFGDQLVGEVMTPRSVVNTIQKDELLGPLALDELHKTGNTRIPVIDGDIDHIVGVLYVKDLLTVGSKQSKTAAQAMDPRVFYIREDQTLAHALAAFIRTHHHQFIVVNEYRETVGVVSLEDVIESLLGREIVDEFDEHDDLRAVAARNPKRNNTPKTHVDL